MTDGKLTGDDKTKTDLLNSFFVSVFTHRNKNIPDIEPKYQSKESFRISFTTDIIEKNFKKLKVTKSAGPDGLHPWCWVRSRLPLNCCWASSKSYEEGWLSSDWKKCPHHTNLQDRVETCSRKYYPLVSLTSVIGKMMESVIRDSLVNYLIEHNIFCDQQHGFVPECSYVTQLLVTLKLWSGLLDIQWGPLWHNLFEF